MGEASAGDQAERIGDVECGLAERGDRLVGDDVAGAGLGRDRNGQTGERRQVDVEERWLLVGPLVRIETTDGVLEPAAAGRGEADLLREELDVADGRAPGDLQLKRIGPEDILASGGVVALSIGADRGDGERPGGIVELQRGAVIVVGVAQVLGGAEVLVARPRDHAAGRQLVGDAWIGNGERGRQRQDAGAACLDEGEEVPVAGRGPVRIVADQVEREDVRGLPHVAGPHRVMIIGVQVACGQVPIDPLAQVGEA